MKSPSRTLRLLGLVGLAVACSQGPGEEPPERAENIGSVQQRACNNNGTCEPGESYMDCGGDCYCYPDNYCDSPSEDCQSCPDDCGTCMTGGSGCNWNGNCEPANGENGDNCISDCWGCGDGACDPTESCSTCSGDCGSCGGGSSCGDGTCDLAGGEDCWSCAADCTSCCGDNVCDGSVGENPTTCPADCKSGSGGSSFCGDGNCDTGENTTSCPADCTGSGGGQNCCGDPSDPCGYNGDGVCDTGCAWGEDSDCTGGGSTPGGCCADATDSCGWKGDGICNQNCAFGDDPDCMGGTGGTGGGPPPPTCNGCTCGGGDLPVGVGFDAGFEKKWEDIGVGCPIVGGKAGVDLTLKGNATYKPPLCTEGGSFASELGVGAEVALEVELCKAYKFSVTGGGELHSKRNYGSSCNEQTCNWERSDNYCGEKGFSGFAGMGLSRFFGYKNRWKSPGAGIRPTTSLTVSCGVSVGGSVKASAAYDEAVNGGLVPCPSCVKAKGSLELGVQGTGGCGIKGRVGKFTKSFGCKDCAQISLTATGGAETTAGECGNQECLFLNLKGQAAVIPPCLAVGYGWFKIGVRCQATVGASKEFNTCGNKPFAPEDVKFGCNVVGKGKNACG